MAARSEKEKYMKYTGYLLMEPGMDRPCFSHRPPTLEQARAYRTEGIEVYQFELDIPTHELVDGKLRKAAVVLWTPQELK